MAHGTSNPSHDGKHHVLSRHSPSVTTSIAHALVLKDGGLALVMEPDGTIPTGKGHGCGLYWNDMRWLDCYTLTIDGAPPDALYAGAESGGRAVLQLSSTCPARGVDREVGITWHRTVDGANRTLADRLDLRNFAMEPVTVVLEFRFSADFEDIFLVRGLLDTPERAPVRVTRESNGIVFSRVGLDDTTRALTVQFDGGAEPIGDDGARFRVTLAVGASATVRVAVRLHEAAPRENAEGRPEGAGEWKERHAEIQSDSALLDRMVNRAVEDLGMLRMRLGESRFFAAGLPWFQALFGRDSAVTAMQTVAWNPEVAAETLRVLTRFQGTKIDPWRDEQPGKILHELRRGELARAGIIPHTPYYGSVDSTPLYLCLVERTLAWAGDRALFEEIAPAVDAALGWIDDAVAGDGWIWYGSEKDAGLVNQGWKDSGDAIVNADGSLANPPIALVEVQGYVYRAWTRLATVFERIGQPERADTLRHRAAALRARIRDAFRLGDGAWALALQAGCRPCAAPSSNPGHLLWCGVPEPDEARALAARLVAPDLWSGWGVRTLSSDNPRYNPVGYHVGSVWPHDNAFLVAGLRRYGHDDTAMRIGEALVDACTWFADERMPELFAGFEREAYGRPVPYPVACRPQAWGAGAVLAMLQTLLGFHPDAWEKRLRIVRPRLPRLADVLTIRGLRVGQASVDLRFRRPGPKVEVLEQRGELEVVVEHGACA